MAELKTKPTGQDVKEFLNAIPDEKRRQDCFAILEMMEQVAGVEPKMWGDGIVGLGDYHYKGASGREGDWFKVGFSPRKQNLTLYVHAGMDNPDLLARLGKFKAGKGCLYINKLEDVDGGVLKEIVSRAVRALP